jgi:hypothetical protein
MEFALGLFVAKTKTPAEGNWAGFWGADTVVDHINELSRGAPSSWSPITVAKKWCSSARAAEHISGLRRSNGHAQALLDDRRVGQRCWRSASESCFLSLQK